MQQVTSQPFVHAKPTPVRHAAAITIQRYYRQRHSTSQLLCTNTDPDSGLNQSRATANSATANIKAVSIGLVSTDTGSTDTGSTDTASTDSNGTDLTRQQAAVHIQRSWRRYCINAQATAEVAGLSCQIAALPLADQQASTGCQQGTHAKAFCYTCQLTLIMELGIMHYVSICQVCINCLSFKLLLPDHLLKGWFCVAVCVLCEIAT